jgi:hypothetical protein
MERDNDEQAQAQEYTGQKEKKHTRPPKDVNGGDADYGRSQVGVSTGGKNRYGPTREAARITRFTNSAR